VVELRQMWRVPFVRFLASGGVNTLASYLVYLALLQAFSYHVSYTIAYASGIALAYVMYRYFVFQNGGGRLGPVFVVLIYAGQYLLGLALTSAWVAWWHLPAEFAPLFAVVASLPLTFVLNRWVFRARTEKKAPDAVLSE
jgi:putative flippase GtrA